MTITLLFVFVWGWLVTTLAFIEELTMKDVLVSAFAALLWPIAVPAAAIRKLKG